MKDRIRAVRKTAGLTQTEFGARIGATRAMIASYEGGAVIPSVPILKLISREFNVSYDWLKTGEKETGGCQMRESAFVPGMKTGLSLPEQLRLLADALEEMGPEWCRKLEETMIKMERERQKEHNDIYSELE